MRLPGPVVRGVLTPYDRFSEVLFGLIMALTLTGALNVTAATAQETRTLFVATLSCNVAWGFVDAVMYVMNQVLGRGRSLLLDRALRQGGDPSELRVLLSEVLPEPLVDDLSADRLDALRRRVSSCSSFSLATFSCTVISSGLNRRPTCPSKDRGLA